MNSTNFNNNCESFMGSFMENENSFCGFNEINVGDVDEVNNNSYYICENESEDRLSNRKGDVKVNDCEIKEKFNFVEKRLDDCEDKIVGIECDIKHISDSQDEFRNELKLLNVSILNSNNNILQFLMNKEKNETCIQVERTKGKYEIIKRGFIFVTAIIIVSSSIYSTYCNFHKNTNENVNNVNSNNIINEQITKAINDKIGEIVSKGINE